VGERWTLLVLREAFYGLRRFDELQHAVGCARNVLSARLATLVEHGLLRKEPYREPGARTRTEYRLTEKGLELFRSSSRCVSGATGGWPTRRARRPSSGTAAAGSRSPSTCAARPATPA
jgi:hypothetical protein